MTLTGNETGLEGNQLPLAFKNQTSFRPERARERESEAQVKAMEDQKPETLKTTSKV